MKLLSTPRSLPVKLPHPLYFQHTCSDGRILTFRSPFPYRLTALQEYWNANDFQLEKPCPVCQAGKLNAECSICNGSGKYQPITHAESVERTEKVMCAVLGSFWADPQYIIETAFKGDMDVFSLEVSFEIMGGEHGLSWTDCAAIYRQCTALLIGQLYPRSKASKEVADLAGFLSPTKDGTISSPSTLESPASEATPSHSSPSTTSDNSSSSPTTASVMDTTQLVQS